MSKGATSAKNTMATAATETEAGTVRPRHIEVQTGLSGRPAAVRSAPHPGAPVQDQQQAADKPGHDPGDTRPTERRKATPARTPSHSRATAASDDAARIWFEQYADPEPFVRDEHPGWRLAEIFTVVIIVLFVLGIGIIIGTRMK